MKTAMRNLSERLAKTINYYNNTHGVASSYHFKMVKNLVDEEYLLQEKQQIINAFLTGDRSDCLTDQDSKSYAEQYYQVRFGDNPEAGI